MLNLLSIVIGIVFVMLLFSLLATTIMEMLAGLLTLRGKNLINAIQGMLGENETQVFREHQYFQQLSERANIFRWLRRKPLPPSNIRPSTFTSILMDILQINSTGEVRQTIANLPDGKLKDVLGFHYRECQGDMTVFRGRVEEWFNEVMERASEWYASSIRIWLIWVGLTIAVIFNVDVISIYSNLSTNAALQEYVADAATQFVQSHPEPKALDSLTANPNFYAANDEMHKLLNENIAAIRSPLGLGWENIQWPAEEDQAQWFMYKLAGWFTTALAISMGAKFWFDLLRQLVSFRSGGSGSGQAATTTTTATATPSAPPPPVPSPYPVLVRTVNPTGVESNPPVQESNPDDAVG